MYACDFLQSMHISAALYRKLHLIPTGFHFFWNNVVGQIFM